MEINSKFKGKKILAWDENINQFAWVSPRVLTSTVYTENGEALDDILKVTPAEVIEKVNSMLKGAPDAYNSFLEVSKALTENKDSIQEIFRQISTKIKRPDGGKEGQVLKLDKNNNIIFAEDKDTIYTHPNKHPADMIEESDEKQFISKRKKNKIDALEASVITKYDHIDDCKVIFNGSTTLHKALLMLDNMLDSLKRNVEYNILYRIGESNGIATLDSTGKIPVEQLPYYGFDSLVSNLNLSSDAENVTVELGLAVKGDFIFRDLTFPVSSEDNAGIITAEDKKKLNKAASIVQMTLAEYQALDKIEPNTLYICK